MELPQNLIEKTAKNNSTKHQLSSQRKWRVEPDTRQTHFLPSVSRGFDAQKAKFNVNPRVPSRHILRGSAIGPLVQSGEAAPPFSHAKARVSCTAFSPHILWLGSRQLFSNLPLTPVFLWVGSPRPGRQTGRLAKRQDSDNEIMRFWPAFMTESISLTIADSLSDISCPFRDIASVWCSGEMGYSLSRSV